MPIRPDLSTNFSVPDSVYRAVRSIDRGSSVLTNTPKEQIVFAFRWTAQNGIRKQALDNSLLEEFPRAFKDELLREFGKFALLA